MIIECRKMVQEDIGAGLKLCRDSNWNQVESDWQIFLQLGPDACRVAVFREKIVGTVTTINYQHSFSWIGMVLVDPAYRRQGIGLKLLEEALHILKAEETVKLDATPAGRTVYLKLDFVDEYPLSRMSAVIDGTNLNSSNTRPVHRNDLPALAAFDQLIFGANRQPLLEWIWEGAPRYSFLSEEQNEIRGYCLGRHGHDFEHVGPVVAQNIDVAKKLVSAALQHCVGRPVILDVPHFEPEWIIWLETIGFVEQRSFIRMYRGTNRFPGLREKQFAILDPEFG